MGILTKGEYTVTNLEDGRGISKSESTYQKSTSGTVVPTGAWTTNIPSVAAGEYLWTRTLFTYTDNTTSSTYTVGRMGTNGNNGLGISNNNVHYQASSSGTTAPTGTWTATIPTVAANQYLWTRTTITYTDGSTSVSYSVGKMGADGKDAQLLYLTASSQVQAFDKDDKPKTTQAITISAKLQNASGTATFVAIPYIGNIAQTPITLGGTGNERTLLPTQWTNKQWTTIAITATLGSLTDTISVIKVKDGDTGAKGSDGIAGKDGVGLSSTTITYAQSTSGTTPPTTGWSDQVPTLVKGQYLWTRTVWTYTDASTETGYTVSYNAKDGNDGTDGKAGKDGVGISSTVVEYATSASGTTRPTSGWSTTIPTVAEGNFLWTRTTWTYTDNTSEVGYSVAKMGAKGDTGAPATSYWVTPSVNAIQISTTKVLNPTTVTFTGYSKTGTANAGLYAGRFNILTSVDGIVYSSKYSSSANQSAYTYTVPADIKFIKARMYQAGGFTALVDEVTIPIIESAEGLEIGGRNYITDTARVRSINGSGGTNQVPAETMFYFSLPLKDFAKVGDTFTFSTTVEISGSGFAGSFFPQTANNAWVALTPVINIAKAETININRTLTITQKMLDVPITMIRIRCDNVPATVKIDFTKVMLSKGNKALDWVPALEDAKLYPAWSNDPNGKDMVRVYPNENLINLSTMTLGKFVYWPGIGLSNNVARAVTDYIPIKEGEQYTLSLSANNGFDLSFYLYKDNTSGISDLRFTGSSWQTPDANGSSFGTPKTTLAIPTGYKYARVSFIKSSNTAATAEIMKAIQPKMELGTVQTPYTPSPQDDPVKAEMAYIGYSLKDSNDPADYVWSENPKVKGTFKRWANSADGTVDFTNIYPNENLFVGSVSEYRNVGVGVWNGEMGFTSLLEDIGVKVGDSITLSAYFKNPTTATDSVSARFNLIKADGTYTVVSGNYIKPGEEGRSTVSGTIPTGTVRITCYIQRTGGSATAPTFTTQIMKEKLEIGKNATIWTSNPKDDPLNSIPQYVGIGSKDTMNPADFVWNISPEYTQARTDLGLQDKVDNGSYENDKSDIWVEIGNRTTEAEAQEIRDMAESIKNSYEAFINSGGQYQLDLEALEARSALLVQNLGDQLATYNFLKTYIKLGEEGLVIGADGSSMKMLLSKDKLSFTDGGQVVAYFSNQSFYINRGAIVDSLQVGQHKMVKLNSDHTVFQWVKV